MAHDPQTLTLRRITKDEAAHAFTACVGLDPQSKATPDSAAQAGDCFAVTGKGGEVAFSVSFRSGVAWVHAAAGGGAGMAGDTLAIIERLARAHQCFIVAFQTMREGLRRVATRQGYTVSETIGAGWKLEKTI